MSLQCSETGSHSLHTLRHSTPDRLSQNQCNILVNVVEPLCTMLNRCHMPAELKLGCLASRAQASLSCHFFSYVIHESGCWSDVHRQWFFLPRRASKEKYDDVQDEHRATNILITADEAFADVHVTRIGPFNMYRGFSSFKFVPGTKDSVILALKSEENRGQIATCILLLASSNLIGWIWN